MWLCEVEGVMRGPGEARREGKARPDEEAHVRIEAHRQEAHVQEAHAQPRPAQEQGFRTFDQPDFTNMPQQQQHLQRLDMHERDIGQLWKSVSELQQLQLAGRQPNHQDQPNRDVEHCQCCMYNMYF